MNDYSLQNKVEFYSKGFLKINLKNNKSYLDLLNYLKNVDDKDISSDKNFVTNYKETFDLNHKNKVRNDLFFKFIFDQNIPDQINQITGNKYVLGDFTVRKTYSKKSYMNWHRDTYLLPDDSVVGRIPSLIKFIFYPNISDKKSLQLKIVHQSHKKIFRNRYIDYLQVFFSKNEKIYNSNSSAIIFDSSSMHAAAPNNSKNGSYRLIYNFCLKEQINTFSSGKEVAKKFLRLQSQQQ